MNNAAGALARNHGPGLILLVLEIESFHHIDYEIRWVFAALFDEEHFDELLGRHEQNHDAVLAINRIPLDMGCIVRTAVQHMIASLPISFVSIGSVQSVAQIRTEKSRSVG